MFASSVTISIEFAGDGWPVEPESPPPLGALLRIVAAGTAAGRTFALVHDAQPVYTLTPAEADELLRLVGALAPKAPWQAAAGFDGCTYTLALKGPMSGMTFTWWVDVPAGWESVGAVAEYVLGLARRAGLPVA